MKNFLRLLLFPVAALLLAGITKAEPAAGDNPPPRLTIELRDGSRVVGQSVDEQLKFDSSLLGDLKLAVKDIRAIECVSTNSAKLTTASGDVITGWFGNDELHVKTGFGKVELAVNSIRHLTVSATRAPGKLPPGLVALWSAEGDGHDSVGGNDANLTDITFAEGKVGQAFSFSGATPHFEIAENSALNVGEGEGMTILAWIKPSDVTGLHPILEWQPGGVQFWIGQNPGSQGVLCGFFMDNSGRDSSENHYVQIASPRGTLVANVWQHIAITYDKHSGILSLFMNGSLVAQRPWGSFAPLTKGLLSSYRPGNPGDWTSNRFFSGLMDELAIYNRALTADEIKSVSTDQNGGQPLPPPPTSAPGMSPYGRFGGGYSGD